MEEKQLHKHIKSSCDTCEFYDWDDDMDDNVCIANLDEDEYVRMMESPNGRCPFYKYYDEYKSVQKQN